MREIDRKRMMQELEELARWLDVMATMTRDAEMRRKHKARAKAVREALKELEDDQ